jgi:LCP family protein required for cell wall assembly
MSRYWQPDPPKRSTARVVGRILLGIVLVVAMLAVALVAGIYLWFHESVAAIRAHSVDVKSAQKLLGDVPAPGHAAIALVIGYDHRANEAVSTPSRSDTVMLLRADPVTKSVSMMSFPRDMTVNVHCPGQPIFVGKINSAYANCGSKGTLQTVRDLVGLPINYLITVNFRGFKQIVNRLGGVWIDVDRRYYNNNAGLSPTFGYATINLQPGYQLLTGGSALDYVRYRHTDSDLFRVARQQQFVKAMKFQLAHNFSITSVPKIIGALTKNVEVGVGGGGELSGKTVLSYALFAYRLPSGHFFQTQIQGLTGYADLRTDPTNIQAAVQDWLNPDIEAANTATNVALGRKVKTTTPTPAQTTITVLNGNGVPGAAGNAGAQLAQRSYHVLQPPANATGNAPRQDYFPSKVYWNPRVKGSEAAAQVVAKLFAPADAERLPPEVTPLQRNTMLTVVVGTPFHGTIAPAPPQRTPTTREPAHVVSNPYDTATLLKATQSKVPFKLMTPTVMESSSYPDRIKPLYAYRIHEHNKAVRLVFRTAGGAYWGIEETDFTDAPILGDRSVHHILSGRAYDFYYTGPKLHMIVLRQGGVSYWVVNSLLDNVSTETMIAVAKGLRPLTAKK